MDAFPPFQYDENLAKPGFERSIRILDLDCGRRSDRLKGRLRIVSLDDKDLKYDALSYTWGKGNEGNADGGKRANSHEQPTRPKSEIILGSASMGIRENLELALRAFRKPESNVSLWADAICINQREEGKEAEPAKLKEKSKQISLMGSIYTKATEVKIWLGDEDGQTQAAFDLLKKLLKIGEDLGPDKVKPLDELGFRFQYKNKILHPAYYSKRDSKVNPWPPLFALLRREWFTRVWVIQEAALATKATVVCGSVTMDLDHFNAALHTMAGLLSGGESSFDVGGFFSLVKPPIAIAKARRGVRERERKRLHDLLMDHNQFKASDTSDFIYALLGIAGDVNLVTRCDDSNDVHPTFHVTLDYSIAAASLYTEVAGNIITTYSSLEILSAVQPCSAAQDDNIVSCLPSWVPNWSLSPEARILTRAIPDNQFAATRSSKCQPSVLGKELILKGFIFDEITEVSDLYTNLLAGTAQDPSELDASHAGEVTVLIYKFMKFCGVDTREKYANGEDMDLAFALTMSAGAAREVIQDVSTSKPHWRSTFRSYRIFRFLQSIGMPGLFPFIFSLRAIRWVPLVLKNRALLSGRNDQGVLVSRRLLRSRNGYIGLAPRDAQSGDSIVLLEGGALPFIVRTEKDCKGKDVGKGKLIGESYVHGLMEGEKWDAAKCHEIRLE
jgi:hypothetical protein